MQTLAQSLVMPVAPRMQSETGRGQHVVVRDAGFAELEESWLGSITICEMLRRVILLGLFICKMGIIVTISSGWNQDFFFFGK